MKRIPFIVLFIFSFSANAQVKRGVFNTTINSAKKVSIENVDGIIKIQKADSVFIGQLIINVNRQTKLFLVKYNQEKDSTGIYITVMEFSNPNGASTLDIDLIVLFDKPYESAVWGGYSTGGAGGGVSNSATYSFPKNNAARQKIGMLSAETVITLTVKSKEWFFSQIYGIDGAYN